MRTIPGQVEQQREDQRLVGYQQEVERRQKGEAEDWVEVSMGQGVGMEGVKLE